METSRFFVTNLPVNTSEKNIQDLFQDYGEIQNIELKTKKNLVDPDDLKIIAFVTLNIGKDDAQYCLNDLNWQKVNGQNIQVSLAKESFLERLKREREEAKSGQDSSKHLAPKEPYEHQSDLLNVPRENKRKTFDVNAELDDDEVAPELMITKKRAATSMHNGKIVIQTHNVEPIHVIENKQKKKKQLENKPSSAADQKRKESLNKMKNQYEQKKNTIQQALQEMGSNKVISKKIKFSDAESDQEETKSTAKTNIFGSDDENEDDDDINFKSVPLGKKGEKLAKMRAEQSIDPRFRIDEKFVEDDDDVEEGNENEQNKQNDVDDERQWQMNILEQVTGTKMSAVNSTEKAHKNKKMLRYDPSKDDHQKFERTKEQESEKKMSKKYDTTKNESDKKNSSNIPEVSKEVFYVVTDTLQQSLRTRGEGFSLLNMFGRSEQLEKRDEQLKQLGNEKILLNNNKLEKSFAVNPFTYDSSSESEGEELTIEQETNVPSAEIDTKTAKNSKKKNKIVTESFFIPKNDIRLKEGAKFFIYKKSDDATTESYEEVRHRLKLLIKTKITKTKKNLVNAGYKGKRKI